MYLFSHLICVAAVDNDFVYADQSIAFTLRNNTAHWVDVHI